MTSDFFIGLDLGQAQDFTAVVVVERPDTEDRKPVLSIRHLHRFPLGTPYPAIIESMTQLLSNPSLKNARLIVDATGVGKPVVDFFRRQGRLSLVPVIITFGHVTTKTDDGTWHVPKKELVGILQLLLQTNRLKAATTLPNINVLMRELQNFQVKITAAGNETYGAVRERAHDDMVLALALACWRAEKCPRLRPEDFAISGESVLDRFPPGVFHTPGLGIPRW